MRQSNIIVGTLVFAFVVFITMRDELPSYLDLFKKRREVSTAATGEEGGGTKSKLKDAAKDMAMLYLQSQGAPV